MNRSLRIVAIPCLLLGAAVGCTTHDGEELVEEEPPPGWALDEDGSQEDPDQARSKQRLSPLYRMKAPRSAMYPNYGTYTAQTLSSNDPGFNLDAPFWIELGRGSGSGGLAPIRVSEAGEVLAYRRTRREGVEVFERASFIVDPVTLERIREVVRHHHITELSPKHINWGIVDGSQWILRIGQGSLEKILYVSNQFPTQIVALATALDELVEDPIHDADWEPIEYTQMGDGIDDLWDAMHRRDAETERMAVIERRESAARFIERFIPFRWW